MPVDVIDTVNDPETVQVVRAPSGEEFVFIPKKDFDALVDALENAREDLEDIAAYDRAKAEIETEKIPPFPPEVNLALLRGERRLSAIRKWRSVSADDLAAVSGVSPADLVAIEAGDKDATIEQAKRIAKALNVHCGWLVP